MDNAIPSLLIGALLLVATTFMARSGIQAYDQLGSSLKAAQTRVTEQTSTRLAITGATLNPARDTLTVQLRNEGNSRLAAYDRLDVIVTYYTSPGARMTAWMPFAGVYTANTWSLASILNDAYEPGILNPGETAEMEISLGGAIEAGKTNLIVIGSEAGSTVSAPFTS